MAKIDESRLESLIVDNGVAIDLGRALLRRLELFIDLDVFILKAYATQNDHAHQQDLFAAGYQPAGRLDGLIEFRKRIVRLKYVAMPHWV